VASHAAHLVADDRVNNLLMTKARVVMETAKFLLETRRENRKEFGKRLLELGASRGWTVEGPPGHAPDGALAAHFFLRFDADTAENIAAEAKQKFGLVTGEADDALRSGASLEHKTSGADEGLSAATDTRAPVIVESAQAHTKGEDDSVIVDNPAQVDAISGLDQARGHQRQGLGRGAWAPVCH